MVKKLLLSIFSIKCLNSSDLVHIQFNPIIFVDVERSFLKLKYLLSDNRVYLIFET